MSKYQAVLPPELINAIRFEEVTGPYKFDFSTAATIEKQDSLEMYNACFGMLIADTLGEIAKAYRAKPVCKLEDLLKVKGTKYVLLISPDDYDNVPDKLKPFTVPSNNVPEGIMFRMLGDVKSGVFRYGQTKVVYKESEPNYHTLLLKYSFDPSKYFIEYYCI